MAGFWTVDLSLSRLVPVGEAQGIELRLEGFKLTNNFNWGNPVTNLGFGQFGRIMSATVPRREPVSVCRGLVRSLRVLRVA